MLESSPTMETYFDSIKVFMDITDEMVRQDQKWGSNRHQSDLLWNTIFAEEVGEVAHEVLERDFDKLRMELVQTLAVGVQWLRSLDARKSTQTGKVL